MKKVLVILLIAWLGGGCSSDGSFNDEVSNVEQPFGWPSQE